MKEHRILQITGLTGIMAALTGFIADWLLYGGFYGGAEFGTVSREIMSRISNARLMAGGVLGPIEAGLYIVGFRHMFLALKPGGKIPAAITFGGLSWAVILGSGAYHSAFVFRGLLLRAQNVLADPQVAWFRSLTADTLQYMHLLYNVMFVTGLAATVTFLWLILFRKTLYPRWMVLFVPTLWVLVLPPVTRHIPAPLGGMLHGGSMNLSFLLYFTVSTFLLWKTGTEKENERPE